MPKGENSRRTAKDKLGFPPRGVATEAQLLARRDKRREIGHDICERISDGALLREACEVHDITPRLWRAWIEDDAEYLFPLYVRARDAAADALVEEARLIADGEDEHGTAMAEAAAAHVEATVELEKQSSALRALDHARVNRDRMRVDLLKWLASKRRPREYGDKLDLTSDGEKLVAPVVMMPPLEEVPSISATAVPSSLPPNPPSVAPTPLKALLARQRSTPAPLEDDDADAD